VSTLVACVVGCAHAATLEEPTADHPLVRQPDGVFMDVPAARPPARPVAPAGGGISLSRPVSHAEVQTLVRAYFRVFVGGDPAAFAPLLAAGARRLEEGVSAGDLAVGLERRLHAVDYSHVPLESLAAYDEVRVTAFEDALDDVRGAEAMHEGDVLVDVPMRVQRVSGVRVFGPRVLLLLRREDGRGPWRIAAIREPDGPWS
jgi:hypothetical protein